MDEVVVNGVRYVREREPSQDVRIVVLHRGNVVVGRYSREGDDIVIRQASVVRQWGTTRGLGQIAADGPTATTALDPCGVVRCHYLAVIMTIDCEAEKWTSKLT